YFLVTRTGSTANALTVNYTLSGTATPAADYLALSGTVTIAAGATSALLPVVPAIDTLVEGDETVLVTLSTSSAYVVDSANTATVTIADSVLPIVSVQATGPDAAEGPNAASAAAGEFTITRTGSTAAPLTVLYTSTGTATAGSDYTALTGSVTIP